MKVETLKIYNAIKRQQRIDHTCNDNRFCTKVVKDKKKNNYLKLRRERIYE